MKKLFLFALILLGAGCATSVTEAPVDSIPTYDHVVVVIEENHSYDQITNQFAAAASYINQTLIPEGASFTQAYGEEHRSQGNYLWLFSGSRHDTAFTNPVPVGPFDAPNLATSLMDAGHSFAIYSEGLPAVGSTVADANGYARRHNPVVNFSNVPTSANRPFSDFPSDFTQLPTVSLVVPNVFNDMHDGEPGTRVTMGDTWLKENIDAYYQWAKTHNSLLIVTWDEDDGGINGLTDPQKGENHIATVFAGAHILPGQYPEGAGINHINMLRTLETIYNLPTVGTQTAPATAAGLTNGPITDVFH